MRLKGNKMEKIKEIKRCYNCGEILQNSDPNAPGYIRDELFDEAKRSFFFCEDCYRKEKYHKHDSEPYVNPDFFTIIEDAKKRNGVVLYFLDLISFETSFSKRVSKALEGMDVVFVASKFDLLPKGLDKEALKDYIIHHLKMAKIKTEPDKIILCDAFNTENVLLLKDYVMNTPVYMHRDIYIIGAKMSGKTTFTNAFMKVYHNDSKRQIVTQKYPNTELKVLSIPFGKYHYIYDVDGIDNNNSIAYKADNSLWRAIYIKESLKVRSINLNFFNRALFIGGIAMVELEKNPKDNKLVPSTIDCYFADTVELKKSSARNNEQLFSKRISARKLYPIKKGCESIRDFDTYEIEIDMRGTKDIGIEGLGFISFKAQGQTFRIYVPKGVSIYVSNTKVLLKKE